ncbi:hypothetical protein DEHRE_08880 [Dehalobacter restrictus DSM 9455]|uniref:Uncharacterized protein n=1 Tax=Dehalobacter restrictus (strain DSM 9455 / PER-K23) TaxID=871738 RepID=A0ABM5PAF5_DEHRP|nr:hypothetical protein DEHRE_08880 [Dehalobacter restrictus DSM 9455]
MLLLSPGFWAAMLSIAIIMWVIKMLWRIDKNVKSIEHKLNELTTKKDDSL